jgi:hypothetical protein
MALNVLEKSLNLTLPDMYEPWTKIGGSIPNAVKQTFQRARWAYTE